MALGYVALLSIGVFGAVATRCFLGEHTFTSIYGLTAGSWLQHYVDFANVPLTLMATELPPLCTFYLSAACF